MTLCLKPLFIFSRYKLFPLYHVGFFAVFPAVGTLENEKRVERLEDLNSPAFSISGDYREKLRDKGIDTTGFHSMESAEGTMSVFASRLKNGRSWCEKGLDKFIDIMVTLKDNLEIKTHYRVCLNRQWK
nr:UPF0236 family protein [Roseburia sp. 1XD42-34]